MVMVGDVRAHGGGRRAAMAGVFDKDVPAEVAMAHPSLYAVGKDWHDFNIGKFSLMVLTAIYHGTVVFFIPTAIFYGTNITDATGTTDGLYIYGTAINCCCQLTVNYKVSWCMQPSQQLKSIDRATLFCPPPTAPTAPVTCNGGFSMTSWMDLDDIPVSGLRTLGPACCLDLHACLAPPPGLSRTHSLPACSTNPSLCWILLPL